MADDDAPVPFTHHRRNVDVTEPGPCQPCKGTGKKGERDCSWCDGTAIVNHVVIPAGAYIERTKDGERPSFYAVSAHFHRQLRALASLPRSAPMPDTRKVIEMPKGGIEQTRIEVTGLGRGGVASFKRAPNKALKHYLARNLITQKQYDAGMELYFVFEDVSIPPGMTLDPTRDFSGGGGWCDFMPMRVDSHRRLETLFKAVGSKAARQMIYDVCCLGKMLTEGSYGHFKDTRAKMACFKEALDDLRDVTERAQQR